MYCLIARRAETRGFQPFSIFSSTTSLPLCFGRSLKDNSCLLKQSVRGKPGFGCTRHMCASQQASAPQQRGLALGQSCLVSAAGVGRVRDPLSNVPWECHKFFNNFFKKRGRDQKTPCVKCHGLWTPYAAFIYFCISMDQLNHKLRVLTRKL